MLKNVLNKSLHAADYMAEGTKENLVVYFQTEFAYF